VSIARIREVIGGHLGQVLTPEIACALEMAAREPIAPPDKSFNPVTFGRQEYHGYVFAVERLREILPALHPLHEAHFLETEKHRLGFGLDMDYDYLMAAEHGGRMLQFTLRHDGVLVGNIRMFIATSLHTATQYASEDTFFVLPAHRKGLLAIRFWQFMEQAVKAIGVREIRTDSKVINKVHRLNEYCGYTHVANKFVKVFQE
jgi:hypothetical protein